MRLTVLGTAASYAGPGQACSGYLIEADGARVLIDCGNGVLANLARLFDPVQLDAVFVTHRHPDHFLDLYPLQALLRYAPKGPAGPLPLYSPMGLLDSMKALLSDRGGRELDEAFVPVALLPRERIVIGDLTVTPFPVEHTDPTFALVIESDGARLAYTSDTSWGAPAIAAARGADLLLCEATLPEEYADASPHLTASQAGELAREAAVKSMLLTHLWPTNDREVALAQARAEFSGPIALATEFEVHEIGEPKGRF